MHYAILLSLLFHDYHFISADKMWHLPHNNNLINTVKKHATHYKSSWISYNWKMQARARVCGCVCLYTCHPCIIKEVTAAIKENPERSNEKDGYKFSNIWSQLLHHFLNSRADLYGLYSTPEFYPIGDPSTTILLNTCIHWSIYPDESNCCVCLNVAYSSTSDATQGRQNG